VAKSFVCVGVADRFDESLVLLKRALGLRSIVYVTQRVTTTRPRTEKSKEELIPIAERFNAYDVELYRWASEQFEKTISEQDADFVVELAALRTAVAGGRVMEKVPPASELSRERLWEELVRARADVLGWEYELAKSKDPDQEQPADQEDELRGLLKQANQGILQLNDRIEGLEANLARSEGHEGHEGPEGHEGEDEPADNGAGRPKKRDRVRGAPRLEQLRAQIVELEEAIGDQEESTRDVHVVRELERLRALAAEVEEGQDHRPQRRTQVEPGGKKSERRQTPHQRATRLAALEKNRENTAGVLARSENRLVQIRAEIEKLEAAGADQDETPPSEPSEHGTPKERYEQLLDLAADKERKIELVQTRLSELDRRLKSLADESESSALEPETEVLDQPAEVS